MRLTSHGRLVYVVVLVDDDHSQMYQMDDHFRTQL